jgi:nucleoside-diphosphate-sugar epimerase
MTMQTIVGINGATGIEIAKQLIIKGLAVRGVSRREFKGAWEHLQADVLNASELTKAVAGSEVVYCCVGLTYDLKIWQRDWPILIENMITACLSTNAKLVFIDNVYMYGKVEGDMTESTPMNPCSEKGKVRKAVAEKLLDAFAHRGLKGCIARSADFYGPNCANSGFNTTAVQNAVKGKTMQWLGKLDKKHAFTFIPDIGRSVINLGLSDAANGKVWHLPTAKAETGLFYTQTIANQLNTKSNTMQLRGFLLSVLGLFIPVLKEFKEMMYQFDDDYFFNSDAYEKQFNDHPTPYEKGIHETIEWYKNN